MELIDREELLRIIDRKIKYVKDDVAMDRPYNVRLNSLLAFKSIILNCKCIDAVPVVRCKDCSNHGKCMFEDVFLTAGKSDGYCYVGRKKHE